VRPRLEVDLIDSEESEYQGLDDDDDEGADETSDSEEESSDDEEAFETIEASEYEPYTTNHSAAAFAEAAGLKYYALLHVPTEGQSLASRAHWNQYYKKLGNDDDYDGVSRRWRRTKGSIVYDSSTKRYNGDSLVLYVKNAGLSKKSCTTLRNFLVAQAVETDKQICANCVIDFAVSQPVAELFAERCGFLQVVKPFFEFCKGPDFAQTYECVKCPKGSHEVSDPNNNFRQHFAKHDGGPWRTTERRTGRCINPGSSVANAIYVARDYHC
jgi:hypothetical protein